MRQICGTKDGLDEPPKKKNCHVRLSDVIGPVKEDDGFLLGAEMLSWLVGTSFFISYH